MADSITPEIAVSRESHGSDPFYGEVSSKKKKLLTRIFGALTCFLVFLATIFCFVKGAHNHTMYLLLVNLMLTTFVVGSLTWWYYTNVIPPERFGFMIFLGLCLIFQSIVTDIYVWENRAKMDDIHDGGQISPTISPPNTSIHTLSPIF